MYYSSSFTRKFQTVFSCSFRTSNAYHLIRFSIYSYRSNATVPKVYPKGLYHSFANRKWYLCALILNANSLPSMTSHISERISDWSSVLLYSLSLFQTYFVYLPPPIFIMLSDDRSSDSALSTVMRLISGHFSMICDFVISP